MKYYLIIILFSVVSCSNDSLEINFDHANGYKSGYEKGKLDGKYNTMDSLNNYYDSLYNFRTSIFYNDIKNKIEQTTRVLFQNTFENLKKIKFVLFINREERKVESTFIEDAFTKSIKQFTTYDEWKEYKDKYKNEFDVFTLVEKIKMPINNYYLFKFTGLSMGENINSVIMIFEKINDQYKFVSIVDRVFRNFFFSIKIIDVIKNSDEEVLLVCSEGGGDGGKYYEKIWVGKLRTLNKIDILYENMQDGYEGTRNIDFKVSTDYEKEKILVKLIEENISKDTTFTTVKIDTIKYSDLSVLHN